jgi:hypothetical protein
LKAKQFGFKIDFSIDIDTHEELIMDIVYLNPFKYLDCINGYNITPYESGYNHLTKLIKWKHCKKS